MRSGQGTIEYMVILAVVVVVALVVVSLMINSTSGAAGISLADSKIYWQAQPLAIIDVAIDPEGDGKLVIKNNTGEQIEITEVLVDDAPVSFNNGNLSFDEKIVLHLDGVNACLDTGSYKIEITYISANGLTKKISGQMPLIVNCDPDIQALYLDAGVILTAPSNGGVGTTNQTLEFSVSGSDINQCTLLSTNIPGDHNITGTGLIGAQTIPLTGLTGMGTNYEWNIQCCNIRNECATADTNFTFIIPNQAPSVSFNPEPSGTFSGGVPIPLLVSDADGAVSELTAQIYYKDAELGTPIEANSVNLATTCFADGNYLDERNCDIEWQIDDPGITGSYWIDVNVTDGEMSTLISTTGSVTINPCTIPINPITLSADTDFCSGTYNFDDPENNGVILFGANGGVSNPLTLNCHGATFIGTQGRGISTSTGRNYLEIKNCNFVDYPTSVYLYGGTGFTLDNVELKNSTSIGGNGVYIYSTTMDLNIYNSKIINKYWGINFNAGTSTNFNITDNNFTNLRGGIYGGNAGLYNTTITNNNFTNIKTTGATGSGYAIYGTAIRNTTLDNSNTFNNVDSLAWISSGNTITDIDTTDMNAHGTQLIYLGSSNNTITNNQLITNGSYGIYAAATNNTITDNNITRTTGNKEGIAIYLKTASTDSNIERNHIENWSIGLYTKSATHYNLKIHDNNFFTLNYGIYNGPGSGISNATLTENHFKDIKYTGATGSGLALYTIGLNNTTIDGTNTLENVDGAFRIGSNNTIDGLNTTDSNMHGPQVIYISGLGNIISNSNIYTYGGYGIYTRPSIGASLNLVIEDTNIVRLGTKGGKGIYHYIGCYDCNVFNTYISNWANGLYFWAGTHYRPWIDGSIFSGNNYGIKQGNYPINTPKITNNIFENNSEWGVHLHRTDATNITVTGNDFINNSTGQLTVGTTPIDSTGNYWDDHIPCAGTYSFTGGADSAPVCSPIN